MSELSERACRLVKERTTERLAREVRLPATDLSALFDNEARALANARASGHTDCALELLSSAHGLAMGLDSHVLRASRHARMGQVTGEVRRRLLDVRQAAMKAIVAADALIEETAPQFAEAAE